MDQNEEVIRVRLKDETTIEVNSRFINLDMYKEGGIWNESITMSTKSYNPFMRSQVPDTADTEKESPTEESPTPTIEETPNSGGLGLSSSEEKYHKVKPLAKVEGSTNPIKMEKSTNKGGMPTAVEPSSILGLVGTAGLLGMTLVHKKKRQ